MKKVKLTRGYFALVDNDDFDKVKTLKWSAVGKTHIYGRHGRLDPITGKIKSIYLHRYILDTNCKSVDHINGNTLDCRRCNLREVDQSVNVRNRLPRGKSKYMGVVACNKKWSARIVVNGKQIHIGSFNNEKIAAMAYNEAAKKLNLSQFCRLNKISEKYLTKHLPSIRHLPIFTS